MVELPVSDESWQPVRELPTNPAFLRNFILPERAEAVELKQIACAFCGATGRLVSRYWPTDESGAWPVFADKCPRCRGELECVYMNTIN